MPVRDAGTEQILDAPAERDRPLARDKPADADLAAIRQTTTSDRCAYVAASDVLPVTDWIKDRNQIRRTVV
jgi:hypothetical protein